MRKEQLKAVSMLDARITEDGLRRGSVMVITKIFGMACCTVDRIPSTTPGAEPPRDAKDSGSARSHSTHLETSSSNRP